MEFFEKIYVKDLDGNLFMTNTPIYLYDQKLQKEIQLTPQEFDKKREIYTNSTRYSFPDNNSERAFQNFRDFYNDERHRGPDGGIEDVIEAVNNKAFAPSFQKFVDEVLVQGRLFAVLTARGHSPDNLCRGFKMINSVFLNENQKEEQITNIKNNFLLSHLSDQEAITTYFEDIAYYIPISNKERCKNRGIDRNLHSRDKKVIGMERYLQQMSSFIEKIKQQSLFDLLSGYDKKISVGFSDDLPENIIAMLHAFMQWGDAKTFPWYQFRVYYTGDMNNLDFIKKSLQQTNITTESQEEEKILKFIL